ncbi:MAG TPA: protein-disulfide reductase DsbD domain-containing protein [Planctomycetota bacterium]|nr:protein-disulfide reductase DsbD domain-containing protein [Planctomycetota bacterium]
MLSALALFSVRLPAQDPPAGAPIAATGLPETAPLKLTADATAAALTIRLQIEPGWHLYGRDTGGGQPVRVVCLPDSAFAAAGPLRVPMDQQGKITGKAELVLPLRAAAGGTELRARLQFMVCDALQCLPPIEVTLNGVPGAAKPALAVLLVAVAVDARADRIAAFLKDRGCQPTVTTWNTVSAAECDGADVVLADSPLFGKTKPANVANFPVTKSPVVTVGFLGTELLKAQKVTMASGYI